MSFKKFFPMVFLFLAGGGLAGCCLLSGNPTVTISGPSSATTGQPATFTATATGGSAPYTYTWSFGATGATATYTFSTAGSHTIGVTVTDNCGKTASAMHTVSVTESQSGNISGRWVGTISDNTGTTVQFELQLSQVGVSVTGTAFIGGLSSTGNGTFSGGQFQFQFQWPATTVLVTLVGSYNPYADELSGDWLVGGQRGGFWRVRR